MIKGLGPLLVLLALSFIVLRSNSVMPVNAQQQAFITIDANGSISPSTAPIQQTGNTFVLTSNFVGSLTLEGNNAVLDGDGHTLSGVFLNQVSNTTVKNFVINGGQQTGSEIQASGKFTGIYLDQVSNSLISNNTVTGVMNFLAVFEYYETLSGIYVFGGHTNVISGNFLDNNFQGMQFENTSNNLIVGNTITLTTAEEDGNGYGEPAAMNFEYSSNNTIFHNNFEISNGRWGNVVEKAKDSYYGSLNIWDKGYPSGGNYWMNYQAQEINNSGIGDKAYIIDGPDDNSSFLYNTDRYPLMEPFNSTFYMMQTIKPELLLLSPLNQSYRNSSVSMVFSADVLSPDRTVNWTGYSLDGQKNVTVSGNATLTELSSGLHSITVYANDTYGNMGASENINFTITKASSSFPFATVTAVASASAIIVVVVCSLIYLRKHKR